MMEYFQNNSPSSIGKASNELDIPSTTIHKILLRNHVYPYHDTPVHFDFLVTVKISNWLVEKNIPLQLYEHTG